VGKSDIQFVERQFLQPYKISLSIRTTYKYDVQYYKCVVCSMATLCMMRSKGVDHLNLFLYMVLLVYNIYLLCDSI